MASNPRPIETRTSDTIVSLGPVAKRLRTVVVDDSPEYLDVLCALLDLDGYVEVVGTATDGFEALEAVDNHNPDLVLMDVHMPAMDGLVAAELISARSGATDIVLMSSESSRELKDHAKASGAHALIFKPHFRSELPAVLAKIGLYPMQ